MNEPLKLVVVFTSCACVVVEGGEPVWRPEAEDQPGQGRLLRPSRLPAGRPAVGRRRPRRETHLRPSHRPSGTAEGKGQAALTFLMHVSVCVCE